MMMFRPLICAAALLLVTPAFVAAQFIGGGTPDMNNGAPGINQPSSYEGQRTVRSNAPETPAAEDEAAPAPQPATKKKVTRKKTAAVKPKTAAAPADKASQ